MSERVELSPSKLSSACWRSPWMRASTRRNVSCSDSGGLPRITATSVANGPGSDHSLNSPRRRESSPCCSAPVNESRTKSWIAASIEEAEKSRDEATQLLEDYKVRLAEARKEADRLREQGRKEGERLQAEIVSDAQGQRERVLSDAEQQIQAQARAAASGIRDDVVQLALLAAEKVSRRSLSDDEHRKLIEQAIDEADLSALAGNGAKPAS